MSEISTAPAGAGAGGRRAVPGPFRRREGRILDEFVALTGYHRKHAIRVLNGFAGIPRRCEAQTPAAVRRGRPSGAHRAWEASDRICGKRLKPLLPFFSRLSNATDI